MATEREITDCFAAMWNVARDDKTNTPEDIKVQHMLMFIAESVVLDIKRIAEALEARNAKPPLLHQFIIPQEHTLRIDRVGGNLETAISRDEQLDQSRRRTGDTTGKDHHD